MASINKKNKMKNSEWKSSILKVKKGRLKTIYFYNASLRKLLKSNINEL